MTEELIAVLSKIPGLRVIARTSVIPYRSSGKSVTQIGTELGVGSILEGSVRKSGDRLRITLQLIDVSSQEHVWSEKYDRQLTDVFGIQTEVAESTAKLIRVELSDRAREFLHRTPTTDMGAYELYLRAVLRGDAAALIDAETFRETVALLEQAIERDSRFALAYARLGYVYVVGAGDFLPHRDGFARARSAVNRALELDPDLSEAHWALGSLAMQEEHDWTRAEEEFRRALALNPSDAEARSSYSNLLRVTGRFQEAEQELRAALEINPTWWVPRWGLVDLALSRGEIEVAKERVQQLLRPDPNPMLTHLMFAVFYADVGRSADAHRELDLAGRPSIMLLRVARALGALGELDEARGLLAELTAAPDRKFVSGDFIAALYAVVGDKEKALATIEADIKEGESGLWLRHPMPAYDSMRDDPRFQAALRTFHLPDSALRKVPRRQPTG